MMIRALSLSFVVQVRRRGERGGVGLGIFLAVLGEVELPESAAGPPCPPRGSLSTQRPSAVRAKKLPSRQSTKMFAGQGRKRSRHDPEPVRYQARLEDSRVHDDLRHGCRCAAVRRISRPRATASRFVSAEPERRRS